MKRLLIFLLLFAAAGWAQNTPPINNPLGLVVTNNTSGSTVVVYGVMANVGNAPGPGFTPSSASTAVATITTSTSNATLNNTLTCSLAGSQPSSYTFYRLIGGSTQGVIGTASTCSFTDTGQTADGTIPDIFNRTGIVQGRESVGTRLRRAAAIAKYSNPFDNYPWTTAQAWVTLTAYRVGDVVNSNGELYVCHVAGTTGASAPSGVAETPISDGTVTWYWLRQYTSSPSLTDAPTITEQAGAPAGLTNIYYTYSQYGFSLANVTFRGGYVTPGFANGPAVIYQIKALAGQTSNCGIGSAFGCNSDGAVEFFTDAPKFGVNLSGSAAARIIVDGRYTNYSPTFTTSGTYNIITDYTSTGGRRTRRVRVEHGSDSIYHIYVDPASKVWPVDNEDTLRVFFVGDSIVAGGNSFPDLPSTTWPAILGHKLGWSDVWNGGVGGTGYITAVTNAGNFASQLAMVCGSHADMVVISGGLNDDNNTAAAITAAALSYFQSVRACLPSAPIVVTGVWPKGGPLAAVIAAENAVFAAFTQWNDSLSYWIPLATDPAGSWLTGTGNVGAQTGSGNQDVYISADGTHPDNLGDVYMAQRMYEAMRQNVLPLIP